MGYQLIDRTGIFNNVLFETKEEVINWCNDEMWLDGFETQFSTFEEAEDHLSCLDFDLQEI